MAERFFHAAVLGAIAVWVVPATALAQSVAYTSAPLVVYAGPGDDYPTVAQLPAGVTVTVMGCVDGYTWCDVAASDLRGWAYGGSLAYAYQGSSVPVLTYGTVIGVPIVTFAIGNYWGSYYRNRSWYRDEPRWAQHPPPPRGAPPPEGGRPPRGEIPPSRGAGPAPMQGRPPQERGEPHPHPGAVPIYGGPPPQAGGAPMHAGPSPQPGAVPMHGGPPPQAGGAPMQGRPPPQREEPPPQRGGALPQRQGPPPQHGGPPHGGESEH
ncbi:SH3 domain-containing protein [Caballeronia sp. Lep1P3]|uniref:SH3 domain-containing protein n=1 Tax=Caballeronia sp. Lep1P3 TaxID=2878150 RepID=UPI001FD16DB6|nr:SH3 domain-containing protein [Caballeronia sp. Lep1P3]